MLTLIIEDGRVRAVRGTLSLSDLKTAGERADLVIHVEGDTSVFVVKSRAVLRGYVAIEDPS